MRFVKLKHPGNCGGSLTGRLASGGGRILGYVQTTEVPAGAVGAWRADGGGVGPSDRACARDLGITSEVLRKRVRQAEADRGERPAQLTTSEREELRSLRREVAGLRRANAILKDATAYFAAELDPTRQR